MRHLFLVLAIVVSMVVCATCMPQADDYIHLPGKSCKDAPSCPDNRPCVMARPRCNVGTCPDLVPTCGRRT